MKKKVEIEYLDIAEKKEYETIINSVIEACFKIEKLNELDLYVSIILTNPENIKKINKEYRNIDKETDVLSFPMFEKEEIEEIISNKQERPICETIGDIVISVDQVKKQAEEYGHSFTRELLYMVVHGFYHLMGYDHIKEDDKKIMRAKEEKILNDLKILR